MVYDVREEMVESITLSLSINSFNPVAEEMFDQLVARPSVVLTKLTSIERALVVQQLAGCKADVSGVRDETTLFGDLEATSNKNLQSEKNQQINRKLCPLTRDDLVVPPGHYSITFNPSNGEEMQPQAEPTIPDLTS